jgi:hypothetical protein
MNSIPFPFTILLSEPRYVVALASFLDAEEQVVLVTGISRKRRRSPRRETEFPPHKIRSRVAREYDAIGKTGCAVLIDSSASPPK